MGIREESVLSEGSRIGFYLPGKTSCWEALGGRCALSLPANLLEPRQGKSQRDRLLNSITGREAAKPSFSIQMFGLMAPGKDLVVSSSIVAAAVLSKGSVAGEDELHTTAANSEPRITLSLSISITVILRFFTARRPAENQPCPAFLHSTQRSNTRITSTPGRGHFAQTIQWHTHSRRLQNISERFTLVACPSIFIPSSILSMDG